MNDQKMRGEFESYARDILDWPDDDFRLATTCGPDATVECTHDR